MDILIGSYTEGTGARGITRWAQDPADGGLEPLGVAAELTNPSYLAWHPSGRWVYAVGETTDGTVHAFGVPDDGGLEPRGAQPTGGADPCHLAVDPTGRWLVVANYGGGSVALFPIRSDGTLGPRSDLVQHTGSGPVADRQAGPHVHMVQPHGEHVFVTDLGTDEVYGYTLDGGAGRLRQASVLRLPAGTGPRHLAFGPRGGAVLVGELDSSLTTLQVGDGALRPVHRLPATARPPAGANLPSAVSIARDGRCAYLGNRGAACVSVFALGDGERDEPRAVADLPCGGTSPRDVALVGDYLYVANQDSGTVATFRVDLGTGRPEPTGAALSVPAPACVAARPSGLTN